MNGQPSLETLRQAIDTQCFKKTANGDRIIGVDELTTVEWLFDFRALLLQSTWLDYYAELFWEEYSDQFPFQVCGMETAAISLVAAIVMKGKQRGLTVNGLYLRKSRKRQGLLKAIEGTPTKDPVILVDDLINRGNTFTKQIKILSDAGVKVVATFTLLAFRKPEAYKFLTEQGITTKYIFTLKDFGMLPKGADVIEDFSPRFTEEWRFSKAIPYYNHVFQKSTPALGHGNVYFGTDSGNFYALTQKDGEIVWSFKVTDNEEKGIVSSPLLHNQKVFFGAYDGNVYALDALTGQKIWIYDGADWVGSSPTLALDKKMLFIGLEFGLWKKQGGIVALDIETGKRVWQQIHPGVTHCTPLYIPEENMVVIGSNNHVIYAYEATTGKLLWSSVVNGAAKSSFVYDPLRRCIYFGTIGGGLFYALGVADGVAVFSKECLGMFSTPVLVGNVVYFASLDKHVYAYDVTTWKRVWAYKTKGRIFASPFWFANSIWIGSNDGCLYELDEKTGVVKNHHQFSERIVNRIAINEAGDRFFVGTQANELYCLKRIGIEKVGASLKL